jgi:8-oxo-dGTP pyrophosphatase MutT (NUDIX family)
MTEQTGLATPSSYIDKLALILVRDRKQLVARTAGKTAFFTPGGKREDGESDAQALVRECKEELNVEIVPETMKPYGVFQAQAFGKPEGTMVRMTCYTADYEGTLTASSEIEELVRFHAAGTDSRMRRRGYCWLWLTFRMLHSGGSRVIARSPTFRSQV